MAVTSATAPGEVGILALQGDFAEHELALQRAGLATRRVRGPADLAGLAGLVLPGGESTTMLRLLAIEALERPLLQSIHSGIPVLATCAGLILLATEVSGPVQHSLGVLDIGVERNGYGRQSHSGTFPLEGPGVPAGTEGVFIRAPRILRCGKSVDVLARRGDDPVLVRSGSVLGAAFHPELQHRHPVMTLFAESVHRRVEAKEETRASAGRPGAISHDSAPRNVEL